jgi:hypothetical protein
MIPMPPPNKKRQVCFVVLPRSYGHGAAPAWCIVGIALLVATQLFVTLRDLAASVRMQQFQNERVGRAFVAHAEPGR